MKQQSIVTITLLISVFLLFSTFTSLYAASPATFGYTQVGQNTDMLVAGYKDSCRYLASESGTVNSISMYVQTANAQVRFGVYSDQNGKPSQLLAQSNQVATAANQWVTASLTASIVAGQYYWLTVTTNAPIRYYIDYASGGASGYAIESTTTMSTNYGAFTAYTAVKYSMYATYTAAVSVPAPSPIATPTPKPTTVPIATPTPKPTTVPIATPTPVSGFFGNTHVGQYVDTLVQGYKDSCRYLASESGTVNSISMYVQTANAQVRFGVYSDQNGKPSQLLAQSNQVATAANQWVTASLTASIVAGQYYWLTVTTNAPIRYYIDYASGGASGYAIESTTTMSTNYGAFTAYTAVKYSMYATYTAAVSVPAPSPIATPTPKPTTAPTATPTPTPTPTHTSNPNTTPAMQRVNGIWTQPGQPTQSNCNLLVSMNIKNIYLQAGDWRSDGSIDMTSHGQTSQMLRTSVANAHAAGLKIYAWINDAGINVPLATSGQRATAINSLINLVQTYGFDGVTDDIETWHSYSDLIAYFNEATIALHAIGKEYFTAIISYWISEMSAAQLASIHVDRIQPMLYELWESYETNFKAVMNKLLTYATSPVGLGINSYTASWYNVPMTTALSWVDAQLLTSPTAHLSGIDIFWYTSMDSSKWTAWNNWSTKN